jgi:hypothetical protein
MGHDKAASLMRRATHPTGGSANWSPATTRLGFAVGALASLLWMADGMLEQKSSLVLQNIAFLIINAGGYFRWKPTL